MFGGLIASCVWNVFVWFCESLNFELVMLLSVITPHYCSDMSMFRVKKGVQQCNDVFVRKQSYLSINDNLKQIKKNIFVYNLLIVVAKNPSQHMFVDMFIL